MRTCLWLSVAFLTACAGRPSAPPAVHEAEPAAPANPFVAFTLNSRTGKTFLCYDSTPEDADRCSKTSCLDQASDEQDCKSLGTCEIHQKAYAVAVGSDRARHHVGGLGCAAGSGDQREPSSSTVEDATAAAMSQCQSAGGHHCQIKRSSQYKGPDHP